MALIATAETAQDVASGFNKFLEPVSESSIEITGLIAECFAISSALRELSTAAEDPRNTRRYASITEDIRLILRTLEYTFDDVHRLCGGLGRPTYITVSESYRQVWREIETTFQLESRNSLCDRLVYYRRFIRQLISIIEGLAILSQQVLSST